VAEQGIADRGALEAQAHEQNRILGIGSPGVATIKRHVDIGEQVAGNPVWVLDVEIAPEGGAPYTVQKREIIYVRLRREAIHVAQMGWWTKTIVGAALVLGGIGGATYCIVELTQIGTCASGGPYVSAGPCPDGIGLYIAGIFPA